MPSFNGMPDIWDLYAQMQVGNRGWTAPGGIEGSPNRKVTTTSGSANWRPPGAPAEPLPEPSSPGSGGGIPNTGMADLMAQQRSQAPNLGGTMARKNQSYFPNTGSGSQQFQLAPGVAEGQARMAQIANSSTYKSRRAGGQMVYSPNQGSMWVPSNQVQDYAGRGYTTAPPQANLQESYNLGVGAPNPPAPQVVPGAGGNYLSQGGVMNPVENLGVNSPYSTFGSNLRKTGVGTALATMGTFAANLFSNPRAQAAAYMPNYNTTGYTPPSFAGGGSYRRTGPNRYFDY